jgi:hypothetical protein
MCIKTVKKLSLMQIKKCIKDFIDWFNDLKHLTFSNRSMQFLISVTILRGWSIINFLESS